MTWEGLRLPKCLDLRQQVFRKEESKKKDVPGVYLRLCVDPFIRIYSPFVMMPKPGGDLAFDAETAPSSWLVAKCQVIEGLLKGFHGISRCVHIPTQEVPIPILSRLI